MFLLRDLMRKCLVSGGWPHHGNVALEAMAPKLMILLGDLIKEMLGFGRLAISCKYGSGGQGYQN